MITILHGDDIASSRNHFINEKRKSKNPIDIRGDKVDMSDLKQIFEGESLFFDEKEVFIELLLSGKRKSKQQDEIIEYLNNRSAVKIFIWENNEISKTQLAAFKKADLKLYKLPQSLFLFLDGIRPNSINNLTLFHNATKNSADELVFFMLIRQFRLLLALTDNSPEAIDEVKRLAPWQRGKLERQARIFGQENLKKNYKRIFEIDYKTKSGRSPLTLVQAIDFLLAEI
ncbi:hypothetical protein M1349_01495 [Patescibacteria group bacterium]|nr:hypothetical protein [Patescibacteria group bacterium]